MTDGETRDPNDVIRLHVSDSDNGDEALKKWATRLGAYLDEQGSEVEVWRRADTGHRPYPAPVNAAPTPPSPLARMPVT